MADLLVETADYQLAPATFDVKAQEQLSEVRWSQFKSDPLITRVVFEGSKIYDYEIKQDQSEKILVSFDLTPYALAEKVIVIDPGHGGSDPGAVSKGGLQ